MDYLEQPPHPNRERYDCLIERRRALLELERLHERISTHPGWQQALIEDASLSLLLKHRQQQLNCLLCDKACQAKTQTLHCDLQNIYVQLVMLAKLWVALEDRQPLEGVLVKDDLQDYLNEDNWPFF